MGNLSDKDLIILDELQKNCRTPFKEIASKAGVPLSTVYAKIEKFEKGGIIEGYHAELNKEKLGFERTAFTMISYDRSAGHDITPGTMARELAKIPGVQEVYIVAGEWDAIVKICSSHINHIAEHLTESIRKIQGIGKSLTYVCFEEVKSSKNIPLKPLEHE